MKRYSFHGVHEIDAKPTDDIDGEWIRYEDHVEAMKRIAGAPVAQGLDVDAVMTKIQEFASTWAVVGGRFDDGTAMECAEECKAEIRAILAQSAPSASAQQASLEGRAWLFGVAVGMAKELGYDTVTDAFDALRTLKSAAPAPASPAALADYSYQQLFDAIAAATKVTSGTEHIAISVIDFRAALLAAMSDSKEDA